MVYEFGDSTTNITGMDPMCKTKQYNNLDLTTNQTVGLTQLTLIKCTTCKMHSV